MFQARDLGGKRRNCSNIQQDGPDKSPREKIDKANLATVVVFGCLLEDEGKTLRLTTSHTLVTGPNQADPDGKPSARRLVHTTRRCYRNSANSRGKKGH